MCGIAGSFWFKPKLKTEQDIKVSKALEKRGPDFAGYFTDKGLIELYHNRLSIIDLTNAANQPMHSPDGRYTLVFNGEIFNFVPLRKMLQNKGYSFATQSDTEVVLFMLIALGSDAFQQFNGFFALAFVDHESKKMLIARDRYGIKPLHFYQDEERIAFASEVKALTALGIEKELNKHVLQTYFRLNYIPAPYSIYKGVKKLKPGHFFWVETKGVSAEQPYYQLGSALTPFTGSYKNAKEQLFHLLEDSVATRLVADVPLGCFLSGGVDSSIISFLASKNSEQKINTFSIGYADEPFYDETKYANLVAEKIGSNHTVFSLKNQDFFEHLDGILEYIDEPFADPSAVAVNILCKRTSEHLKVCLSGDGGDELFAGYNKHFAEFKANHLSPLEQLLITVEPILGLLPSSRGSFLANKVRQVQKFATIAKGNQFNRYKELASFQSEEQVNRLLKHPNEQLFEDQLKPFTQHFTGGDINEFLLADIQCVLQGDMLTKVDLMSMKNSLEVRVPLLDYRVVDFANSLPAHFKIDGKQKKKILIDTFKSHLPEAIFNRNKKGFEVPLVKFFQTELFHKIDTVYLQDDFIIEQGIFNVSETRAIKNRLRSKNPGDIQFLVWSLVVFQNFFINEYNH